MEAFAKAHEGLDFDHIHFDEVWVLFCLSIGSRLRRG